MDLSDIHWVGDVIVPLGVLILSTVFTLSLARVNRRQVREDQRIAREQRYADRLVETAGELTAINIVALPGDAVQAWLLRLGRDIARYENFVSDGRIPAYRFNEIWRYLDQAHRFASARGATPQEYDDDAREFTEAVISELQDTALEWIDRSARERITRSYYPLVQPVREEGLWPVPDRLRDRDWLLEDFPPAGLRRYSRRLQVRFVSLIFAIATGRVRKLLAAWSFEREQQRRPNARRILGRAWAIELNLGIAEVDVLDVEQRIISYTDSRVPTESREAGAGGDDRDQSPVKQSDAASDNEGVN